MVRGGEGYNVPAVYNQGVLARDHLLANDQLAARRQAPATRTKRAVQNPAVLDLGQVDDAVGLDLDVELVQRLHQHRRRLRAKGCRRQAVEGRRPVDVAAVAVRAARERRREGC